MAEGLFIGVVLMILLQGVWKVAGPRIGARRSGTRQKHLFQVLANLAMEPAQTDVRVTLG